MISFIFKRCPSVSLFKIFTNNGNSVYKPLFQCLVHLLLLSLSGLAGVVLGQVISELLVWRLGEGSLLPQVRGQVRISVGNGSVCCFCYKKTKGHPNNLFLLHQFIFKCLKSKMQIFLHTKVAKRSSTSPGTGVAIINSSHL